jgi:hypothetical protein
LYFKALNSDGTSVVTKNNPFVVEVTLNLTSQLNLYKYISGKNVKLTPGIDYDLEITDNLYKISFYSNSFISVATDGFIFNNIIATPLKYGQPLSDSVISGSVKDNFNGDIVNGKFTFVNPKLIPQVGNTIYNVLFTPNDMTNYSQKQVMVNVFVMSSDIPKLNIPLNIQIGSDVNQNIFKLNPFIDRSLYKIYSSNTKITQIDCLGNIIPKSKGKFYIIVTDTNGNIIYTSTLITVN